MAQVTFFAEKEEANYMQQKLIWIFPNYLVTWMG